MTKAFSLMLLLLFTAAAFAQSGGKASYKTEQQYLRKSRWQKAGAWLLVGIGGVSIISNAVYNKELEDEPAIGWLLPRTSGGYILGGACIAGSIPLFVGAAKNKKRAAAASLSANFKIQKAPVLQSNGLGVRSYPAVGISAAF